jgi:hypothetical protein
MLCLEVSVNGEKKVVAGVVDAEALNAAIRVFPGLGVADVHVTGDVVPDDQPPAEATWFHADLARGDEVTVRLVESENPSPAKLGRTDPGSVATDSVPIICAFCGNPSTEVDAMIASTRALICHSCVKCLYGLVAESEGEA